MSDVKPRARAEELTADAIVTSAVGLLRREGLGAVSMRRVAAELGVSPIPLYSRVGNKEALLEAIAERMTSEMSVAPLAGESWTAYASRWCDGLRDCRKAMSDGGLLLRGRRGAMERATRPLIAQMIDDGVPSDGAIRSARLLLWAVLGHAAIEIGHEREVGGEVECDRLFDDHVRHLISGLEADFS